jgi:hypothetical protein
MLSAGGRPTVLGARGVGVVNREGNGFGMELSLTTLVLLALAVVVLMIFVGAVVVLAVWKASGIGKSPLVKRGEANGDQEKLMGKYSEWEGPPGVAIGEEIQGGIPAVLSRHAPFPQA